MKNLSPAPPKPQLYDFGNIGGGWEETCLPKQCPHRSGKGPQAIEPCCGIMVVVMVNWTMMIIDRGIENRGQIQLGGRRNRKC